MAPNILSLRKHWDPSEDDSTHHFQVLPAAVAAEYLDEVGQKALLNPFSTPPVGGGGGENLEVTGTIIYGLHRFTTPLRGKDFLNTGPEGLQPPSWAPLQ